LFFFLFAQTRAAAANAFLFFPPSFAPSKRSSELFLFIFFFVGERGSVLISTSYSPVSSLSPPRLLSSSLLSSHGTALFFFPLRGDKNVGTAVPLRPEEVG